MKRIFLILLGILWGSWSLSAQAQLRGLGVKEERTISFSDSIADKFKERAKLPLAPISDYLRITVSGDTIATDTTLTQLLARSFNVARTDLFGRIPFSNIGRPMGELIKSPTTETPLLGNAALQYTVYEQDRMQFYRTPTPLTELMFLTTHNRGQLVDGFLATNLSPNLNIMLGYRGHRSEGHYAFEEVSSGSFRTSINYQSKNKRFGARAFYTYHDLKQQEHGGLLFPEAQFESQSPQFSDRKLIDVRFGDINHRVVQRSYYIDKKYTLAEELSLLSSLHYDSRYFQMQQNTPSSVFAATLLPGITKDQHSVGYTNIKSGLEWNNPLLGKLTALLRYQRTGQYFNSSIRTAEFSVPLITTFDDLRLEGDYKKKLSLVYLSAQVALPVNQSIYGLKVAAQVEVPIDSTLTFSASVHREERLPALNKMAYQSNYLNYNWNRLSNQPLEKYNRLVASLASKSFGKLSAGVERIENYTYFASLLSTGEVSGDESLVRPYVSNAVINLSVAEYENAIPFGKWTADFRARYQQSGSTETYYNVPKFILRSSLYYSTELFQKAMFAQIGVRGHYFDAYYADAYHPILAEFYVQNTQKVGGYPLVDLFFDAKIRTMRLFLTYQHLSSGISSVPYYAAPNYPYRDGVVRFGFIWNFFD